MEEKVDTARVLVVDDTAENIRVASALLRQLGCQVSVARDGAQALKVCQRVRPDLILLDIMMPEMDGHECCRRLKEDEATRDIPVIFLTAMSEVNDVVRGFDAGGVDYVTKPFNGAELQARVATHLRLRRLQETVERNYRDLQRLEEVRNSLVHMIIHDMRTPLGVVEGYLDMMIRQASAMEALGPMSECVTEARQVTGDVIAMVGDLLDISRMEDGKLPLNPGNHDIGTMIEEVGKRLEVKAAQFDVGITVEAGSMIACCDRDLVSRVLTNLTANAIKFSGAGSRVRLENRATADSVTVSVIDTGPGVPVEYQEKIFEKFGQVDAHKERMKLSTGLGLTFCKLAVEAHGGRIGVDSDGRNGSRFWFTLPFDQGK